MVITSPSLCSCHDVDGDDGEPGRWPALWNRSDIASGNTCSGVQACSLNTVSMATGSDEEAELNGGTAEPQSPCLRPVTEEELEEERKWRSCRPELSRCLVTMTTMMVCVCRRGEAWPRRLHLLQCPGGKGCSDRWRLEHHPGLLRGHPHRTFSHVAFLPLNFPSIISGVSQGAKTVSDAR